MILCTGMVVMTMAVTSVPAAADSGKGNGKQSSKQDKLDSTLNELSRALGWSRVIVTLKPGADIGSEVRKLGGKRLRNLRLIGAQLVELPNGQLKKLAERSDVLRIDHDRPVQAHLAQVSNIVGARTVQSNYGLTGAGVGIAVIDSGITNWHDDLTPYAGYLKSKSIANQRVTGFVDFVNGATQPYDDNGHGTHVSGIIAGLGVDSDYTRIGVAPLSHIISLKVLDAQGRGVISNVIAAMDYAVENRHAQNIRVINLSIGAAVTTSYDNDPLTLAAKRAVEAGIVVVSASGNLGRNAAGQTQYGGITSPANAPWVLTVGAANHNGTLKRTDDTVANFSSRGPTAIDHAAKPDIVAPGTGVVSLSSKGSTLYLTKAASLLVGSTNTDYMPYLTLSGSSMAAPVVAGTVALMLEANPNLTPNLVKAMLQFTAEAKVGIDYLSQGGGFLNAKGAVDLARYFANAKPGERYPYDRAWARKINWGNRRLSKGALTPAGNAWALSTVWGSAYDVEGDNVVWGTGCDDDSCRNVVWGTFLDDEDNVVWGTVDAQGDHVVWGTFDDGDDVVWGTFELDLNDNVVWGTIESEGDNVVWGTNCGGDDCFNMVWGTVEGDNVVWGTLDDGASVVWGTAGNIPTGVWATNDEIENIQWDLSNEGVVIDQPAAYDQLFVDAPPPVETPVGLIDPSLVLIPGLV